MSSKLGARRRASYLASLLLLALAVVCGSAEAATETPGETFAASVDPTGEYSEGGVSGGATISADGRFVAFLSGSANLNSEGTTSTQAYVKDLDTGAVTLASRSDGAEGPAADEPVTGALLSADARYLVFESSADNLVDGMPLGPVPPVAHVYRRDLETGETTIVDRAEAPEGEIVPIAAHVLAISDDGSLVAFSDSARELEDATATHAEGEETIYVRDLAQGTTTGIAAEGAEEASFSADGRYLLFTSSAATLPEPTGSFEVYRRDLETGETILVSRANPTGPALAGEPAAGEAYEAVFVGSSDCEVAFLGEGTTNLTPDGEDPPRGVYLRDFCTSPSVTTLLSIDEGDEPFEQAVFPSATADGRVAFIAQGASFEPRLLYLRDPVTRQTTLLDRATGPEGEPADREVSNQAAAMVAAGGCRAIFTTNADNLFGEEEALPGGSQTFVRQLAPCKQAASGEEESKPGSSGTPASGSSGQSPGPAVAMTVRVGHLSPKGIWLTLDGAGKARIRVQKLVTGRHHGWHKVRDLIATAAAAGPVEAKFSALAPGRYRFEFRLQGDPDNPTMTRHLTVGAG
jgi:WD40-like Beta Propeller Repeat